MLLIHGRELAGVFFSITSTVSRTIPFDRFTFEAVSETDQLQLFARGLKQHTDSAGRFPLYTFTKVLSKYTLDNPSGKILARWTRIRVLYFKVKVKSPRYLAYLSILLKYIRLFILEYMRKKLYSISGPQIK